MTADIKKHKVRLNRIKTWLFQNAGFFLLMLIISLSFQRCANMQRPTGGPKDSIPPKVLNESPPNLTRNFDAERIVITFDEFVKITNQAKEFSITPEMPTQPIFKIRKKNLVIEMPDSIEANTTYTINLGKGLVDFNESNPILNYTYVFATGEQLDSLTLSGNVTNGYMQGFDYEQDKDVNVILIPTSRDSIFGKKRASIFTTVDSAGNFMFRNLREDAYRIYAIKEQNNDRTYNAPDEWIGFLKDSIYLDRDISGIKLEISQGIPRDFRTMERKLENDGTALLTFNRRIVDPVVRIIDPPQLDEDKILRFSGANDSVRVFLPSIEFDSIKFEIADGQNILDTVQIRKPRNLKLERKLEPQFNITNKVDRVRHLRVTSSTPIADIDKGKIVLLEDSVSRRNFQLQRDSIKQDLYHIRYNWRPKRQYEVTFQEGAITGFFGEKNEEKKLSFTADEDENYGDIHLTFVGLEEGEQYIVELISEDRKRVFDKRILPANRIMSYVKYSVGKYTIRMIWDQNRNGVWDPADVWTLTFQEPIWYLDRIFTIRANWEQNETVEVQFQK